MSDHHTKSSRNIWKGAIFLMAMMAIWLVASVTLSIVLNHPTDLEHWKQLSSRPDFTLIDSVETQDHYICVYDTNRDEIAFCVHAKVFGLKPPRSMLEIANTDGVDVYDSHRSQRTSLAWERRYCFVKYAGCDGMVYPIIRETAVPLHIRYAVSGKDQLLKLVYSKQIDWKPAANR